MLDRINSRLKEDGVKARVEQRGHRLCLRATLPLKDGAGTKQQRILLETSDLVQADLKARQLGQQLRTKTFSWAAWEGTPETAITCGDFRAAGRKLYESKYSTETAWSKKWRPALNKLPPDSVLMTDTVLLSVIERLPAGSAGKRDTGNVLSQIAQTLKFDVTDIRKAYKGYAVSDLKPREIPSDQEIEHYLKQIKLPHWRWMFGMLACYGLRPHEIIQAKITADGNCEIGDETKTGFHIAWPCHKRWLTEFNLRQVARPSQSVEAVAKAANTSIHKRGPVPFSLYTLRHAYAIRLFNKGIPSDVGARLMGHSEQIHRTVYKRWYDAREIEQLRSKYDL